MTTASDTANEFFDRYAEALLARDEQAMARLYAVPSLILFPGNSRVVDDASQTAAFFAAAWNQYAGIDSIDKHIAIMGEAPASIWVDVSWSYSGRPRERFCYQLIPGPDGYQIAVVTPMA
jgi:hypothetical protein